MAAYLSLSLDYELHEDLDLNLPPNEYGIKILVLLYE